MGLVFCPDAGEEEGSSPLHHSSSGRSSRLPSAPKGRGFTQGSFKGVRQESAWGRWLGWGRDPTPCAEGCWQEPELPPGSKAGGTCRGDTHVGVAITQDLVQDVAELPAEDGTAGQGQPDGVGPEGERSLLVVCPQDDPFQGSQGQLDTHRAGDRLGWGLFLFSFH